MKSDRPGRQPAAGGPADDDGPDPLAWVAALADWDLEWSWHHRDDQAADVVPLWRSETDRAEAQPVQQAPPDDDGPDPLAWVDALVDWDMAQTSYDRHHRDDQGADVVPLWRSETDRAEAQPVQQAPDSWARPVSQAAVDLEARLVWEAAAELDMESDRAEAQPVQQAPPDPLDWIDAVAAWDLEPSRHHNDDQGADVVPLWTSETDRHGDPVVDGQSLFMPRSRPHRPAHPGLGYGPRAVGPGPRRGAAMVADEPYLFMAEGWWQEYGNIWRMTPSALRRGAFRNRRSVKGQMAHDLPSVAVCPFCGTPQQLDPDVLGVEPAPFGGRVTYARPENRQD